MSQYFKIEDDINETLKGMFSGVEINAMRFNFTGNISVFFVRFDDAENFKANWKNISFAIGINFQNKMEDEFSRWNIYIIYVSKENVPLTLKYEIENDKVATRKIVESNCDSEINDEFMIKIIDKHIVNSDIKLSERKKDAEVKFINDSKVWNLVNSLDGKPLKGKPEDALKVLENIEKMLKNEN